MKLKVFQEQIFFATARITVADQSGSGASIGTGFLYRMIVSQSQSCILLVSNKHVYGDGKTPIQLIFHKRDPAQPSLPALGETMILEDKVFDTVFTVHPDPAVDLACVNVSQIGNPILAIFFKHLDDNLLPDFDHEHLLPGNDVWFVGYPENRFDTKHNLPILRRGYIASIPKVDFEGRREFLIDAQVFQGSSGSPVFTELDGQFKLIGIVTKTMIRNEKLQTVPAVHAVGVNQAIGLGIVLKATLLRELFDAVTRTVEERLAKSEAEPTQDTSKADEQSVAPNGASVGGASRA